MARASKNGGFAVRLVAPVRLAAKGARHFRMRARRGWKGITDWPVWRLPRDLRSSMAFRRPRLRIPLHRVPSEMRACPACGSSSVRVLEPLEFAFGSKETRIGFASGCASCGLVFANPMPAQETLDTFYSREGHWGQDHRQRDELLERQARRALSGQRKDNDVRRSRHVIFDALQPYVPVYEPPPGAAVLDYGCGDGKLLNGLQQLGWKTYGVEPSSDVAFLRHERLVDLPSDPSFDLVVLHHVLEHVPRPLDLLTRLVATLRPGGSLFISVPRLDTLPQHRDFRYCINGRTHLVCFSEVCLRELLGRAGIEPIAALSSPDLDAQLSRGRPLRLRLVARKTGAPLPHVSYPLRAAIRAFREYRRGEARGSWLEQHLPVRVRAHRMDRQHRLRVAHSTSAG